MKKIFVLLTIIGIVSVTSAQERWSIDKRLTSKPPVGNYVQLPNNNYYWENNNNTTRVFETPQGVLAVGPNFRVLPNSHQQDELILKTNPVNPLIMFGGANTTTPTYGQGGYLTTDGGVTWSGTDLLAPFTQASSDPGPIIDKNGVIIFTVLDNPGMVAAYSTNNGTSWSGRITLQSGSVDKNFAGTDDNPTSAYYGRSYAAWSNFALTSPAINVSYTTNGGISWSTYVQVNTPPSGHYSQGVDVATGVNGEVYVCWAQVLSSNTIEDYCGFSKSTNGGVTWTTTDNAFDMNGIRATSFNGWTFRVNSFPRIAVDKSGGPRNGWIYIVETDKNISPAGSDPDIIMHRSTNGGATWSAGLRVNQDALSNGKVQFFPAITVDNTGGVDICYYDNRNYPSVGDSCETFFSRSTDGGNTFTDVPASDHRWLVHCEAGFEGTGYGGDYIGISATSTKIFPFWMDNKSGSMQAWTCPIDIPPVAVTNNNSAVPKDYKLGQNYPNPFNPTTNIKFDVPNSGNVKITVYDMLGNQVELLVNNYMQAGSYSTDFHANNFASGVYFYRLDAGKFSETRKMILSK